MILAFCKDSYSIWKLVGQILFVFKIVIPLLLIIFGMIDLGKAVISSEEKEIKNATSSIMRRLIAAIVIFFIPTIVGTIFNIIGDFGDQKADYKLCETCITKPYGDCEAKAKRACTKSNGTVYGADGNKIEKNIDATFKAQCPDDTMKI